MYVINTIDISIPQKMVVVGDRYLTDIYGGNRYGIHCYSSFYHIGMLTIYVEPFTEENDNFFAKIVWSRLYCHPLGKKTGKQPRASL